MISVVVGWHVYEMTNSALHLGLIGLAQFMAPVLLMIPAGQIADRYNRRLVLRCCYAIAFASAAGLMVVAALPAPPLLAIYALVFLNMVGADLRAAADAGAAAGHGAARRYSTARSRRMFRRGISRC